MENKPEKLILDYSRWRCGEEGRYKVGEGKVALKNTQGYMCCLGQWSLQLGATEEEILRRGEPNEINTLIPLFVDVEIEYGETIMHTNKLAYKCIIINDNDETTPDEKILLLQELLGTHGIQLEVINKPNDNK